MNLSSFLPKIDLNKNKRVLIIHPFGIGDALCMTPLIRALKKHGFQIDLLLGSRTRELFETNPNVHRIYEWDKSPLPSFEGKMKRFAAEVRLCYRLFRNRYQVVLDCSPTGQYLWLSALIFCIPVRVGFNFKNRGFLRTHTVPLADGFSNKPMVEYYLDLIRKIGIDPDDSDRHPEIFLSEADNYEAQSYLDQHKISSSYMVAVPGGGESWGKDAWLKRWPVEYFASLIEVFFQKKLINDVIILGGRGDSEVCEKLNRKLQGHSVINFCAKTSLRAAAFFLKRASFALANDGGLVHLAHAVKCPIVAFYGPVDPLVYGPYPKDSKAITLTSEGPACRPCYQQFRYQNLCRGLECLYDLKPEHVLKKIDHTNFFASSRT